jgi:hypothetical protein
MVLMHDAWPTGSAHSSTAATGASSSRVRHPVRTGLGVGCARPQGLSSRGWSWWLKRGGTTRSLPEHGRETPQRLRYCVGNCVGQSAGARTAP